MSPHTTLPYKSYFVKLPVLKDHKVNKYLPVYAIGGKEVLL